MREEEWSETDIDDVYDDGGSGSLEMTGSGDTSQDTATGSGHHISITDDEDYDDDFEVNIFCFHSPTLHFRNVQKVTVTNNRTEMKFLMTMGNVSPLFQDLEQKVYLFF